MSVIDAVLLGILQGLTEFLPTSSSGHLSLIQNILGIKDTPMLFSILLHVATLASVCIVLKNEVLYIIKHPFSRLTWLLVCATVPTVILALVLKYLLPATFNGNHLGFCFLITSAFLFFSHILPKKSSDDVSLSEPSALSFRDAAVMGVFQGIATLPGISRSGSSILAGALCGISRQTTARFSFLMSIPAILGALVLDIFSLDSLSLSDITLPAVALGCFFAAITGYVCVKWMIKLISRGSLMPFCIYTAILGVFCIIDKYITHLVF